MRLQDGKNRNYSLKHRFNQGKANTQFGVGNKCACGLVKVTTGTASVTEPIYVNENGHEGWHECDYGPRD